MTRRLYALLRWLFPRDFRERFEAEFLATADEMDAERSGSRSIIAVLWDLLATAFALHVERRPPSTSNRPSASRMESFVQDVRFALRGLRRDPAFTTFAVATLAIGIGANAVMFGIVDRLLLRGPDHVVDPDGVSRLYVSHQPAGLRRFTGATVGQVTFDIVKRVPSLSPVAAYANNETTIGSGVAARPARVGYVSGGFFPLLGARPLLGRFVDYNDDRAEGAAAVAVLSERIWRTDFGARDDVVGSTIVIGDVPHTVIGVAPAGFTGAELRPIDAFAPINLRSPFVTTGWATAWNAQWLKVIGRLAPGRTIEQANNELTRAYRLAYTGNEESMRMAVVTVEPLRTTESGGEPTESRVARWLMGVSIIMLLIVCANVANLLLARSIRRTREIAIRLALGAGAGRLRRMFVIESVSLAIAGAVLGLLFAYVLGGAARQSLLAGFAWTGAPVDLRVFGFSMAIALAAGIVVGLVPAVRGSAASLISSLKTGAGDGGGHRVVLRRTLTVAQAAMSVALLVGAGLFLRSLNNARHVRLGVDPEASLVVEVSRRSLASMPAGPEKAAEQARRRGFLVQAIERVRGLPGVTHAAVAVGLPFGNRFSVRTRRSGGDTIPTLASGGPSISAVTPDYFATVGTHILRGRGFTLADGAGSARVAIVSERMARVVWPSANAIGQCLSVFNDSLPCAQVVGVAEDTHRSALREDPSMHFYIPSGQEVGFGGAALLIRGTGDPRALIPALRRELLRLDASITYAQIATLQDRIDPQLQPWKLGTAVLMAAGLLALLVAIAGIYSVTSYLVTMRRREFGVRIALGATWPQVLGLVLRGGLFTSLTGVVLGSLLTLAAGGFLQPLLFEQSARDPLVFGFVSIALVASTLAACLIPGMRANRVNPVEALRSD